MSRGVMNCLECQKIPPAAGKSGTQIAGTQFFDLGACCLLDPVNQESECVRPYRKLHPWSTRYISKFINGNAILAAADEKFLRF